MIEELSHYEYQKEGEKYALYAFDPKGNKALMEKLDTEEQAGQLAALLNQRA